MTRAPPAAFLTVPHVPHVTHTPKRLLPGIFQDQVQITAAMRLLNAGVDTSVIALWMGHENVATHAGLHPRRPGSQGTGHSPDRAARHPPGRYQPPDAVLAFLDGL